MSVAKRELGRTGLQVTTLGYGTMELRGAPRGRDITEEQAVAILNAVLDAGINYIDTSIDYGLSEERIGRYIGHRRSEYYLASKCGCVVGAPTAPRGQRSAHVFTRDNVIAGVEQSLARMKTDYLDVVQFHQCHPVKPLSSTVRWKRSWNSNSRERFGSSGCREPCLI
jgi:aryl-alcohol dehydrogenase-like predicted oxidoreductase